MAYLNLNIIIIQPQNWKLNHGYCDFFLLPDLTHYATKHSYILELKVLPKKDFEAKAEEAMGQQAVEQIRQYAAAPRVEALRQGQPHCIRLSCSLKDET